MTSLICGDAFEVPTMSRPTVFDVGGNNYRVIAVVRYRDRKIFLRWVLNHRDYDQWCKLYRKGKV